MKTPPRLIAFFVFAGLSIAAVAVGVGLWSYAFRIYAADKSAAAPQDDTTQLESHAIQPADLVKQLSGSDKPIVVCVGPHALYQGAHVPGAVYHGAAHTDEGIADLKKWAQSVPKSANIVLYCGCCPLTRCPNIHPAFSALQEMDFRNVKVLWLPTDFRTDWISKGYPVEKAQ